MDDAIEIQGIKIGEKKFKINTGLDLNRKKDTKIGKNSVARSPEKYINFGNTDTRDTSAVASGEGAYALGPGAWARGDYSFSVGVEAYAYGNNSFCHKGSIDINSNESGIMAHSGAFGTGSTSFNDAKALADYSFAEGSGLTGQFNEDGTLDSTIGKFSHAEGDSWAIGDYSHAEGYDTKERGTGAHSEGYNQRDKYNDRIYDYNADGIGAHSEGYTTQAIGIACHSEGYFSQAIGYYNHAGGENCQAGNNEGEEQKACCTAIGSGTKANGNFSFSGGFQSRAKGTNSFSYGVATQAIEEDQFVIGRANIPKTNCAFIIGGGSPSESKEDADSYYSKWSSPDEEITDYKNRTKNILEFNWNGDLWVNGDISYGENRIPLLTSSNLEKELDNYYTKEKTLELFLSKEESKGHLLPNVTQSDNNKILMVVDGVWAATTIRNSEEVAY